MQKVTLFFCDIRGTFDLGKLSTISDDEVKRLTENLSKLNSQNATDFLIYTFVTTEKKETIDYMENHFRELASEDIKLGDHIYSKEGVEVSKPTDILNYIKKLETVFEVNRDIYYADDTEFFHIILSELNEYYGNKYIIHSIIPKDHGLVEVNDSIENYFLGQKQL